MAEPTSPSDPTPEVPAAPSYTYDSPAAPAAPPAAAPAASDPLPPPAYGERIPGYVPPPAVHPGHPAAPGYPGAPGYPAYAPGVPAGRRRRMWDVVLTVILLVLGAFGVLAGLFYAAAFSDPAILDQVLQQQGLGGFDGTVGVYPTVLVVSHVVLYLIALGVSIPMLIGRRIAFWVPLTTGVIAAVFFWFCLSAILLSDPGLMDSYLGR